MIQVVVLAGGMGTRLRSVTGAFPKPLVPANGRPLLDLQLSHFAAVGVRDVIVLTGHGAAEIADFCGDGGRWGLSVRCVAEPAALGTAGAVLATASLLEPQFLVTYGDIVFDFDIARMVRSHRAGTQLATLFLHPNDHPHDSDLVELDDADRIVAFHPYPHADGSRTPNLVNAGIYVMNRDILDRFGDLPDRPDFGKHVFPRLLRTGAWLQGYRSPEYVKDAGTPSRLVQVSRDLESGLVARLSMRQPAAAVFLDRDGTVNVERGRVAQAADMELIPGAAAAIARLNHSAFRTVVVTNQAVIARGDCSEAELQLIHHRMEALLGAEHAFVDRIYYCPHIPDRGFPGERVEFKIRCGCRKPEIGMLLEAARDLNLELSGSWMIGDSTGDIEAARRAGLISILLSTGHGGRDGKWPLQPDVECSDLPDAVALILDRWPVMLAALRPLASDLSAHDIVLIGGQARSGKSQYAAALRRCLHDLEKPAVVIHLDNWLRSDTERHGPSVLDRYDLEAAAAFVRSAATGGGRFRVPRYDRRSRKSAADAVDIDIPPGAVLIVEGVPALASSVLRGLSRHLIAVTRDEEERTGAIRRDYASRGWDAAAIEDLLAQRLLEEYPVIRESLSHASMTFINGPAP